MNELRPAWSRQSMVLRLPSSRSMDRVDPDWALSGSTGQGIRVAVIDSGIEADHPMLGDSINVAGAVEFVADDHGSVQRRNGPHADVYGHGTACAGIIHALAPDAMITSVKVLDNSLRGKAAAFYAGLEWAVDHEFDIINLSLGAGRKEWALAFHELCDRAYFGNSFIVTAANNIQRDSFPSLFASVTSVAANTSTDPLRYHFNPNPPTEFLARGINVEVPWLRKATIVTTGNSFAAPHIAAMAALIKSKHPDLRPFQIKTALWSAAANVRAPASASETSHRHTVGVSESDPELSQQWNQSPVTDSAQRRLPAAAERERIERLIPGSSVEQLLRRDRYGSLYRLALSPAALAGTDNELAVPDLTVVAPSGHYPDYHQPDIDLTTQTVALASAHGHAPVSHHQGPAIDQSDVPSVVMTVRRLDPDLAANSATRHRVLRSLRHLTQINHPHIAPVHRIYDCNTLSSWSPDLLWTMPWYQSDLKTQAAIEPLEPAAAVVAVLTTLSVFQHTHQLGIHCTDLDLQRIKVAEDGQLVITEVGVATAVDDSKGLATSSHTVKWWSRRAPEQLEGAPPSSATDVYTAGLILFELLSGSLPYEPVSSLATLISQRARQAPRSLVSLNSGVSANVAHVADQAVATDPNQRFQSVSEFARALIAATEYWLGHRWYATQPYQLRAA